VATPKEIAFHNFYLPAFCKAAAARGFPLETSEAVQEAIDLTANARRLVEVNETSQVKEASFAMKRALGITPAPAPRFDFSKSAMALTDNPALLEAALAL
jgi:hypothetical protein